MDETNLSGMADLGAEVYDLRHRIQTGMTTAADLALFDFVAGLTDQAEPVEPDLTSKPF